MKFSAYVVIGAAVFALAYLAQAFFGISLGPHTTSSLDPEGFEVSKLLVQTLLGAAVGLVLGLLDRWNTRRKASRRQDD